MKKKMLHWLSGRKNLVVKPIEPSEQYTSDVSTEALGHLGHIPPTVIFGNPRSGTRMCANVLHKHPKICVTDETLALPRLLDSLDHMSNKFLKKYHTGAQLQTRREILARALWIARSTDSVIKKMDQATHIVNKTPRLEHRFDELEALFQTTPPRYVYCVRNAFSVMKSIKNLPNLQWNKNPIEDNMEHYLSSLRQYDKVAHTAPDRVVMINIDDLKSMPNNFAMYEKVFDLMEMPPVPEKIQSAINAMGPQNTMARVNQKTGNKSAAEDLTDEEIRFISKNEEYVAFSKRFNISLNPN